MNIVIIGAGGIGCYYGARLQAAGHKVCLVARGEHLQVMQSRGLVVHHPEFEFDAAVDARSLEHLIQHSVIDEFDLVILCVKSTHTETTLMAIHGWLLDSHSKVPILSLQNGIDNEAEIEKHIGRARTIGGLAIKIGGHIAVPGRIEATGIAQIKLGAWPNLEVNPTNHEFMRTMAEHCKLAGIPTLITPDIQLELWKKLLINNGVNPLSALTRLDTKSLTRHPVYGDIVYRLMLETAELAKGDGVTISQPEIDDMYAVIRGFDAIKTSMLVDCEKGRELEIDAISGTLYQRSIDKKIPAPLTALIYSLVQDAIRHA